MNSSENKDAPDTPGAREGRRPPPRRRATRLPRRRRRRRRTTTATCARSRTLRTSGAGPSARRRSCGSIATSRLLEDLLPALDNLGLGLAAAKQPNADLKALANGVELVQQQLKGGARGPRPEGDQPAGPGVRPPPARGALARGEPGREGGARADGRAHGLCPQRAPAAPRLGHRFERQAGRGGGVLTHGQGGLLRAARRPEEARPRRS